MTAAGAVASVSAALQFSGNLWLRSVSLATAAFSETYLQRYILLDLFGALVTEASVGLAICGAATALSLCLGGVAFCECPAAAPKRPRRYAPSFAARHTSLTLHESWKLLVLRGAAPVLALFLIFQLLSLSDFRALRGGWENYYRGYSQILEGPPTVEKDAWLKEAGAGFDELERELALTADSASRAELQRRLYPRAAFEYARDQYFGLGEGQWYLYRTVYERLFGPEGRREDLVNTLKLMFVLALCLSGIYAREYETGVYIVQRAYGSMRRVNARKAVLTGAVALAAAAEAYLPRFIAVVRCFGGLALSAPAASVPEMAALPAAVTVGAAVAGMALIRIALTSLGALAVVFISKKSRSAVTAALVSLLAVCAPFAAALLRTV